MKVYFRAFALFILIFIFKTDSINGQSDSIRHQISIGVWPQYINEPFINFDFKTYFKKRTFYSFSIEGFYTNEIDGRHVPDYYRYDIATSASLGVHFNFFKVCRFGMAAQLTGFFARQKGTMQNINEPYDYGRSREGVFIGPEFSLEIRTVRFKSSEIAIFSKTHSGFGRMHEKLYSYGQSNPFNTNEKYNDWVGSIAVGISYRY